MTFKVRQIFIKSNSHAKIHEVALYKFNGRQNTFSIKKKINALKLTSKISTYTYMYLYNISMQFVSLEYLH